MARYLGAPEPFDAASNDWAQYLQRFEPFLLANEIKDEQKLQLSSAPRRSTWWRPGELTYSEVTEKLTGHFKTEAD